jgi:phosphoenolpyruvate-protein kinase (PTS system EI component)
VDRDSELVAHLFDERNEAVKRMIARVIVAAHEAGRKVGICGQAPSDYPDFARFLVENGIDSISLNPDAVLSTTVDILALEEDMERSVAEHRESDKSQSPAAVMGPANVAIAANTFCAHCNQICDEP